MAAFDVAGWTSFIGLILIIAILVFKDRKKVKREGLLLIRRTKKGRDLIDKVAQKSPGLWKAYSLIGVFVAVIALVMASSFMIFSANEIVSGKTTGVGVRLVLPGPVSEPVLAPGVIGVPPWLWVMAILIVMVSHEFSHGIVCRLEKIRIKSVGWILLFIIPGAFVEPDEKQLKKSKRSTRLKVYAAGSFANLVVASLIVVAFMAIVPLLFNPSGVYYESIDNSTKNITVINGFITAIDGKSIRGPGDVAEILSAHKPGEVLTINTFKSEFYFIPYLETSGTDIITFISPKLGMVTELNQTAISSLTLKESPTEEGKPVLADIVYPAYTSGIYPPHFSSIALLLIWIYIFNLGIGLVNLLPIKPLDGGFIFETIAEKFSKRSATIVKLVSGIMLAFLIFNLIGPFFI